MGFFYLIMSSWIKLFRDINKHWIWQNSDYLKWWLDILLEVNHSHAKVVIKNKIYDCNRGEKLYSLDTWAHRWGTNKSKARRFLQLLQNDNMIVLKSETQTTRLIVCKYDTYQDMRNGDETQMKRKRNANETHLTPIEEGKEGKEGKEEKEIKDTPSAFSFYYELLKLGAEKQLVSDWLAVRKKKKLTNTETALKGFLKQVDKSGNSLNDVLTKCIEKSWGGFEADWYKKQTRTEEKIRMF